MIHPDPPQAPYFDDAKGHWVLSRYADVLAALQDLRLWSVGGGKREIERQSRDDIGRLKLRGDVLARFSPADLAQWRPVVEREARAIFASLPNRQIDLLRDFALPWGLSLAILATGACAEERAMMGQLSTRVFAATGAPESSPLLPDAAAATAGLDRIFEKRKVPLGEPTFVAFSQTLPRLLTNSWLALAANPDQYLALRNGAVAMHGAVEELLRYGGIVQRVFRRSTAEVEIGGARIAAGELVALLLASANRDPEQFPEPNRLNLARPAAGQVSLGYGRNACVGTNPIRMAFAAATAALVSTFSAMELRGIGEWQVGTGFRFPRSVDVTLFA